MAVVGWVLGWIALIGTVIWLGTYLPEVLHTVDPHWKIVGPSRRTRRRNCPTCRDHYPVCWIEPCPKRDHYFGFDCTGLDGHVMLCQKHEDRYWHIRQMEKELL